ncbi:MAG: NAD(P)-dependent alcohol dehydrogenase [Spirochaetaceae bacterium]|nr:NAD(P)-dependent alcohol dehydrogenase [Spirochaetaceae bacterium]
MKAIVITRYGSKDALKLMDIEKPVPKDDEVLIKVYAASINDWDWGLMRGKPFVIRLISGLLKPSVTIPGVDIAGQVESVGAKVANFSPGDEVFGDISESGFGGFAEYVCVKEKAIALKPSTMPFIEAAAIPHASILAIQGLRDIGKIQAGQKLLINGGGGGVGTFGVQLAKLFGHMEVTGVDSAEKLDMMDQTGFDHVIDYKREDFTKSGKTYDLILDAKTNRSPFAYARVLNPGGVYVTVGGSMARIFQISILGPWISLICKKKIRLVLLKANKDIEYIKELYQSGKLKPVIDGPYKFSEVPEIIEYFGKANHKGKVVVTMEDSL